MSARGWFYYKLFCLLFCAFICFIFAAHSAHAVHIVMPFGGYLFIGSVIAPRAGLICFPAGLRAGGILPLMVYQNGVNVYVKYKRCIAYPALLYAITVFAALVRDIVWYQYHIVILGIIKYLILIKHFFNTRIVD